MKISKNFQLKEFLVSGDYPRLAEKLNPGVIETNNIIYGVESILQPWRDEHSDNSLIITSGYRDRELNDKVGGSEASDHLDACAVDIYAKGLNLEALFLSLHCDKYPWRELRLYSKFGYVHISWNRPGKPWVRRAKIITDGGRRK